MGIKGQGAFAIVYKGIWKKSGDDNSNNKNKNQKDNAQIEIAIKEFTHSDGAFDII